MSESEGQSYECYFDGWDINVYAPSKKTKDTIVINIFHLSGHPDHHIPNDDLHEAVDIWAKHMREAISLEDYLKGVFKI